MVCWGGVLNQTRGSLFFICVVKCVNICMPVLIFLYYVCKSKYGRLEHLGRGREGWGIGVPFIFKL